MSSEDIGLVVLAPVEGYRLLEMVSELLVLEVMA